MVVWFIFSSILQIWYVTVWVSWSILESPLDFEITRVNCMWKYTFGYVYPAKTLISVHKVGQTVWTYSLIWVFAQYICSKVHFLTVLPICFRGEIRKLFLAANQQQQELCRRLCHAYKSLAMNFFQLKCNDIFLPNQNQNILPVAHQYSLRPMIVKVSLRVSHVMWI